MRTRIRTKMDLDPDGMDCQDEFTLRYIPRSSLSVSKGVSFTLCSMKKLSTEKSGFKKSCLEIQRPDGQLGTIDSILSILSILIAEKKQLWKKTIKNLQNLTRTKSLFLQISKCLEFKKGAEHLEFLFTVCSLI